MISGRGTNRTLRFVRWRGKLSQTAKNRATKYFNNPLEQTHFFLRTIRKTITASKLTCTGAIWFGVHLAIENTALLLGQLKYSFDSKYFLSSWKIFCGNFYLCCYVVPLNFLVTPRVAKMSSILATLKGLIILIALTFISSKY